MWRSIFLSYRKRKFKYGSCWKVLINTAANENFHNNCLDRDFLDSCFWLYSNSFPCSELHYSSLLVKLRKTIKTSSNFILLQYLPTFQRRLQDVVVINSIPRSCHYVWFDRTMLRSDWVVFKTLQRRPYSWLLTPR